MSAPPTSFLDALPLLAAGALDADEAARVAAELARHPALAPEIARWHDATASLVDALPTVAPTVATRARLLAAIAHGAGATLVEQVAELFDLPLDEAQATVARIDDAAGWIALAPGIEVAPVRGGPRVAGTLCSLLRAAPGARFPWHRHLGEEVSLVLAGGATLSDGREVRTGDVVVEDASVEHDFAVDGDERCVFAVRNRGIVPTRRPG